jgi:transposase InsO family protein
MNKLYHNPSHPAAYGGRKILAKASKASLRDTEKYLMSNKVYRKFRQNRTKFDRARIFVTSIGHQYQADLMDLQKYAQQNRKFRYLLVVVDGFSRYVFARPLKRKTGPIVAEALNDIFSELKTKGQLGERVLFATDLGTEFWNASAEHIYEQFNIAHFALRPPKKCSLAENAGRYLLDRVYKHMYHTGRNEWVDQLKDFVKAKNARPIKSLGNLAPKDVTFGNQSAVYKSLYEEATDKTEKEPLTIGQKVQIAVDRLPFHKSFHGYFSEKVYVVKKRVSYGGIYRYTLTDPEDNMEISGTYYVHELLPFKE